MEQHHLVFRAIRQAIEQSLDTRIALLSAEATPEEDGEPAVRTYAFEARSPRRAVTGLAGDQVTTVAAVAGRTTRAGRCAAHWVGLVAGGAASLRMAVPDHEDDPRPVFVEGEIVLARDEALLHAIVGQMSRRARRARRIALRGH